MSENEDDKTKAEDSMLSPEFNDAKITPNMRQIGNTISNPNEIDNALAQLIDINEGNIIHEPTCLICANPNREEIENKWTETKNLKDVKSFIKNKIGLEIAQAVIENHMFYHLTRATKEIQKCEYANKIKRLIDFRLTSLDTISLAHAALQERLMGINSLTPGGDLGIADIEKIKTQETARITESMTKLLKIQESIEQNMRLKGDVLSIAKQPFIDIFNQAILNAKNDGERNLIGDILNKIENLSRIF